MGGHEALPDSNKQGCGLDRSSGSSPSTAVDHLVRVSSPAVFFPSATHAPYNQLTDDIMSNSASIAGIRLWSVIQICPPGNRYQKLQLKL